MPAPALRRRNACHSLTASVGIGLSGAPVFAVQAEPGATPRFTPRPAFSVTAGTFFQGEALEVEELANEAALPYDGTVSMTAVLGPDQQWTVSAGRPG
ncbi:hypothetical protein [Streptomyces sp. NPDC093225]|uniref:hypothetical protein n=1 Tax=Streptomyces sp. NPDC093225 TaxID=3366034 RepID=UPI0037FD6B03